MVKVSTLLAGAGVGVACVAAAPTELAERASCTFTDAASAIKGKASCSTITLNNVAVPAGTTLDLTGLKSGTSVVFQGTTSFGYKEWEGPLISVSGTNIQVSGASGHVIDGNGAKWWDGKGSNGGKTKPKFFYAHSLKGTSSIKGLNVKNTPVQAFSINSSSGLTLDSITINNSAGDSAGGHNTDAFDVGSSDSITISNSNIQNQDDCLAINSGTNIKFTGNTCSGGHGISIGSVGGRSDNVVKGVTVENCTVKNSDNGVRIKTVSGATGSVSGVTYSGITLSNIAKYGIVIEQDYENGSPTGTPTSGVPITGLTLKNIKGSVASSGTDVYILCAKGACSGWSGSGISVTGGKSSTKCSNIPSGAGISC
ncbi:glycoside hydrolase family 28 protein [Diplodia corticola]|uniref:endo-polygalacturonase n=1 Tax=Diplodia corticola TaxID=236234 RepID=A0A1J9S0Q8_9PEZI|nr:glycoside hydrolase family 28 protein [Diplodia corticola]OJD34167.1 glycoside hydrolase family 28 protein [Diplodia corticola]